MRYPTGSCRVCAPHIPGGHIHTSGPSTGQVHAAPGDHAAEPTFDNRKASHA